MDNAGLLFIPDISGFTRFVSGTEIDHSRRIIQELLEAAIGALDIEGLDADYYLGPFLDEEGMRRFNPADIYAAPTLVGDLLVIGFVRHSYYGSPAVVALDAETGAIQWFGRSNDPDAYFGNVRHSPAVYGSSLIFGDPYSSRVYALDVASGTVIWESEAGRPMFQHWPSPIVSGDAVFVARHDGYLHKLDARTGARLWSMYLGVRESAGLVVEADQSVPGQGAYPDWAPARGSPIFATPAVSHGQIAVGTDEGILYLLNDVD